MVYTSIDNEKIKGIKKLKQTKYRNMENKFIVEGEHLVMEAYKSGQLIELILDEHSDFKLEVPTIYVTNTILKQLSELENPQEMMGVCQKKADASTLGSHILILDGIQDPGNLGTIIRSAVAFNIDTIILSPDTVDLYNSKVIRASQGMLFHLNIISDDLISIIHSLQTNNYLVYGTKVDGGKSINKLIKHDKFAIIVGNEGSGIKERILSLCDEYIYIDMNQNCESLNVGVAASIIMYELDKLV